MIRKAIIVVLTLASVATSVVYVASYPMSPLRGSTSMLFAPVYNVVLYSGRCRIAEWDGGFATPGRAYTLWRLTGGWEFGRTFWHDRETFGRDSVLVSMIGFPLWLPLVLFAAYPVVTFVRGPLRRRRRKKRGHCLTCGYNLTGLTEPRCPECGTAFTL